MALYLKQWQLILEADIRWLPILAVVPSSLAANGASFGASIVAFYHFLYMLGMVYCSCHIDQHSK